MSPKRTFSTVLAALCILAAPVPGESTDAEIGEAEVESSSSANANNPLVDMRAFNSPQAISDGGFPDRRLANGKCTGGDIEPLLCFLTEELWT
jgi:hypothetical protein